MLVQQLFLCSNDMITIHLSMHTLLNELKVEQR